MKKEFAISLFISFAGIFCFLTIKETYKNIKNHSYEENADIEKIIINEQANSYYKKSFSYFIELFRADLIKYKKSTKKFDELKIQHFNDMKFVAICLHKENLLIFNINRWNKLNIKERIYTFYHEMGHCLYDYAHQDKGIMSYKYKMTDKYKDNFFLNNNTTNTEVYTSKSKIIQEQLDAFSIVINSSRLGIKLEGNDIIESFFYVKSTIIFLWITFFLQLITIFLSAPSIEYVTYTTFNILIRKIKRNY